MNVPDDQDQVRTFAAVPAAERPVRRRRTARVLLVDETDRVLLFADSDPGVPGSSWWMTPGGGIEPGESDRAAAVREVAEETGLRLVDQQLVGPIAVRRAIHGYSDVVVEQDEVFFGAWITAFDVDTAGHTEEERRTLTGHRWWRRHELAGADVPVWPVELLRIWSQLPAADGDGYRRPIPPLDLGVQEESTVPAHHD